MFSCLNILSSQPYSKVIFFFTLLPLKNLDLPQNFNFELILRTQGAKERDSESGLIKLH